MGITKFLYLLFFCSIMFLFYTKENKVSIVKKEEKPLIKFQDSIIYDISSKGVNQIIQSDKAYIYKNSKQLFNATILIKSVKDENKANILSADQIVKVDNDLFMNNNIIIESEDKMTLKTQELQYNLKTQIMKNNSEFLVIDNGSKFKGNNLYMNKNENHIKAQQIHFNIKLKDDNATK